ncbi:MULTISPECIES: CaiB/BaiF CoA transferase family protein [unclassified Xanthobacter]|uniref:CaiB/BaiF CoA transferase family protein n=1 Tax=unclassified Xanthobacter TaxID=2623496 RepID=UPI001EDEBAE0|nr:MULTISPECIES: CoA transferase [unclassified Xanthobacter]
MAGPLQGIRVLDLSTVIAGPYAAQILGDMGAEVLKVEPPQGDIMRAAGPARSPAMGAAFLNANRNKDGLVLDLKQPADRERLLALVRTADVLLHNMRPAAAARLGLGPETLLAENPRLVYCAIVGFGQDGPYRDWPAYDDIIQAAAGWSALEATVGGTPRYAPTIVADKTTALYAVAAINAALLHAARTGQGQAVEVPMFEVMASYLLVEHLAGRTFVPPEGPPGYARLLSRHRRPYATRDGHLSVMPYTASHWQRFFEAAGRADWAADPRLADDGARSRAIDELYGRLAACLPARTNGEWIALLRAADIPCSPVNDVDDLLADPHLAAVGFFTPATHPTEGEVLTVRPPVRFSRTPCAVTALAPGLAADGGKAQTDLLAPDCFAP